MPQQSQFTKQTSFETGFEALKDTAEKLIAPLNPIRLFEMMFSIQLQKKDTNMLGSYLSQTGNPDLHDPDAYAQKKMQTHMDDEQQMKQLQMILHRQMTAPVQAPQEPRAYEKTMQELEQKKAEEIEAQKQSSSLAGAGQGKQRGRMGMPMHQKAQTGMETKINIKSG